MISDSLDKLSSYEPLVPGIARLEGLLPTYLEEMEDYECDRTMCTLLIPTERTTVACGWREDPLSHDVVAALSVDKGSFVLFLPGERYICRSEGRVRLVKLE